MKCTHRRLAKTIVAILVVAVAGCDWVSYLGSTTRRAFNSDTGITAANASTLHIVKTYDLNGPADGPPIIAGGKLIVQAGAIKAFDLASGALVWQQPSGGNLTQDTIAVAQGNVYVSKTGVTAYNVDTGASVFSVLTPGLHQTAPSITVADNHAFVGETWDSMIDAFDATNGQLLWQFRTGFTTGEGSLQGAAYANSVLYALTAPISSGGCIGNATLFAIDAANGTLQWSAAAGGQACLSYPVLAFDKVFVTGSGVLRAFDLTGNLVWSAPSTITNVQGSPAAGASLLFAHASVQGQSGTQLVAIDPTTGQIVWRTNDPNGGQVVGSGELVFSGRCAFEAATGQIVFKQGGIGAGTPSRVQKCGGSLDIEANNRLYTAGDTTDPVIFWKPNQFFAWGT